MTNLLFLAAALAAQQPATIRVTTRMVEVSVVVRDAGGRAVTGLRAEDFHLMDGGREETIRTFAAFEPRQRTGPAEPGVYDNRSHAARPRVATVILYDYLNSVADDESFGRGELLRFLRALEPQTPVALVKIDLGFKVLHDFTTDVESLIATLRRHRPYHPIYSAGLFAPPIRGTAGGPAIYRGAPGPDAQIRAAMARTDGVAGGIYGQIRARQTSSATAALAWYLSRVPGRKNLIWISSAFPAVLAARVRSDDVAIYPVDVRTPIWGPTKDARLLAESTGGVAFDHGNHLMQAIQQAYEDSSATYVLGYYPSHGQWDGRFRPIKVTAGRPGVSVRHRAGYRAALEDDLGPQRQRQALWDAVASPVEAEGLALRVHVKRLERGEIALSLGIDPSAFSAAAGASKNELEVLMVPQRLDGSALPSEYLTLQADAGALRLGALLTRSFTPPRDAYKIRVAVRNTYTGALGTVTAPF